MKDLASFHRVHMAQLPTPIEPLYRLSLKLKGPTIWIKRDDRTGLAGGGNKARKLEYLVAEALKQKSDLLITAGGAQSNHCRQTAAAAVRNRLGCDLVLGGSPPAIANGNLLLDELLGAELHWTAPENRSQAMEELAEKRRRQGRRPYVIPIGGSNRLGALAYAVAMQETLNQLSQMDVDPDAIVFATSSGGTQAGLAVGARIFGYYGRLLGISIDRADSGPLPFRSELAALANDLASLLQLQETFQPQDFEINTDYLGEGYGRMGKPERDAIRLLAREEAVILDPVYTGRAMAGLLDMIDKGVFSRKQNVLFWHTGGAPAVFAYAEEFLKTE